MVKNDSETEQQLRRLNKSDRREQIVLELKLRPHVRISEMAGRFGVSAETIRRDMNELGQAGRIEREHGGASAPAHGHQPGFGARNLARLAQREAIGKTAAALVIPGQTLMIDSGSTTFQMARFVAFSGVQCTVITNSLEVAMVLGASEQIKVIICPGNYLPSEAAAVGDETVNFLSRYWVDACFIGASALAEDGVYETVAGFAAVKKAMLQHSGHKHLLIDSQKFDRHGLRRISVLEEIDSFIVEKAPTGVLRNVLDQSGVEVLVAQEPNNKTF